VLAGVGLPGQPVLVLVAHPEALTMSALVGLGRGIEKSRVGWSRRAPAVQVTLPKRVPQFSSRKLVVVFQGYIRAVIVHHARDRAVGAQRVSAKLLISDWMVALEIVGRRHGAVFRDAVEVKVGEANLLFHLGRTATAARLNHGFPGTSPW
jgi:hypothetical protein